MQTTTTARPHFVFTLSIALIAIVSVFALNLTLEPFSSMPMADVSWVINGGSKAPVIIKNSGEPQNVTQVVEFSWAANGGSKSVQVEGVSTLEGKSYEFVEGVPWAAHGGRKVPAFGFVR